MAQVKNTSNSCYVAAGMGSVLSVFQPPIHYSITPSNLLVHAFCTEWATGTVTSNTVQLVQHHFMGNLRQQCVIEFYDAVRLHSSAFRQWWDSNCSLTLTKTFTCLDCRHSHDKSENMHMAFLEVGQTPASAMAEKELDSRHERFKCSHCPNGFKTAAVTLKVNAQSKFLVFAVKRWSLDSTTGEYKKDNGYTPIPPSIQLSDSSWQLAAIVCHRGTMGSGHWVYDVPCTWPFPASGFMTRFNDDVSYRHRSNDGTFEGFTPVISFYRRCDDEESPMPLSSKAPPLAPPKIVTAGPTNPSATLIRSIEIFLCNVTELRQKCPPQPQIYRQKPQEGSLTLFFRLPVFVWNCSAWIPGVVLGKVGATVIVKSTDTSCVAGVPVWALRSRSESPSSENLSAEAIPTTLASIVTHMVNPCRPQHPMGTSIMIDGYYLEFSISGLYMSY